MPTRPALRVRIRQRLADTAIDPRWDHAAVDAAIAEAIRRYSTRRPRRITREPLVPAGTRQLLAPPHLDPRKVVAVIDDLGEPWPEWTPANGAPPPLPYGPPSGRCWRAWGRHLLLGAPASRTGIWRIHIAVPRQLPSNDTDALDVEEEDMPALVAQACAILLGREALAAGVSAAPARAAQIDADRLLTVSLVQS